MKIEKFSHRSYKVLATQIFVFLLLEIVCHAVSQKDNPQPALPAQATENLDVNHIVSEFTTGEAEFHAAFNRYGYKCDMVIQTLKNGNVTGEYRRTTQVVLGDDGKLEEKVISFPRQSLTDIVVTREDLEDLSAKYQFTLETANASKYKFAYVGKERIDNLDLYIFEVEPKSTSSKERLFSGRIWVSLNDLRIVKMHGKGVQKGRQRFPIMEIYRRAVEGRYLFPSAAFADEELKFPNGSSVHLRVVVRYSDYVKLK